MAMTCMALIPSSLARTASTPVFLSIISPKHLRDIPEISCRDMSRRCCRDVSPRCVAEICRDYPWPLRSSSGVMQSVITTRSALLKLSNPATRPSTIGAGSADHTQSTSERTMFTPEARPGRSSGLHARLGPPLPGSALLIRRRAKAMPVNRRVGHATCAEYE